ncbi:hypothetical protein [Anaeromicrobium sediminis]|uniref:Uncharacterized protein n=1 Tax=Anaeromicrobium sediminis TaxID=1478221 RepID=A0A267MK40_9FIRM|nr:hypothetical protein [Anaeromicrobium sediminis]PAB59817.1 hypothetical protein CCE28_07625 [Anaeromicrobium sediminis]
MRKELNRHVSIISFGIIVWVALLSININLMDITYIIIGQDTVNTVGEIIGFEDKVNFMGDETYIKRAPLIKFVDENNVARIFKGKFQYNSLYGVGENVKLIYSKDNKELVIINSYKEYVVNIVNILTLILVMITVLTPARIKKKSK